MAKIFISTFPFSRYDNRPMKLLEESNHDYYINDTGGKLSADQMAKFGIGCDAVIAGTEDISKLINSNQHLKIIARIGIGLDSVPLNLCRRKNIQVVYTPDAVTDAVAELTLGLMISLTRKVFVADRQIRLAKWQRFQGKSLGESTIGLIGFGRIGRRVTDFLEPFHPFKILVNDILDIDFSDFKRKGLNIEKVSKEEIYKNADILSLHVPKTHKTEGMINKEVFRMMNENAFLINTSRGGIVVEGDLENSLKINEIAGAALDVFQKEPYDGNLTNFDNIILTQHMGSCSFQARFEMEYQALKDILRFLNGQQVISPVPDIEYAKQN